MEPERSGLRLDEAQVVEIRERRARGEGSAELGRAFGVSQSLVCQICTGALWKHVGGPLTRRRALLSSTIAERLAAQSDRSAGSDACWPWLGTIDADGYGRLSVGGRDLAAHRLALQDRLERLGLELGDDEVTRHRTTCPRSCVNGSHLQPGSIADNIHDTTEADLHARGERSAQAKLTDEQVQEIRLRAGNESFASLGREFGVTGNAVSLIARGERWKHLLVGDLAALLGAEVHRFPTPGGAS